MENLFFLPWQASLSKTKRRCQWWKNDNLTDMVRTRATVKSIFISKNHFKGNTERQLSSLIVNQQNYRCSYPHHSRKAIDKFCLLLR
jgi:hypothetical protein